MQGQAQQGKQAGFTADVQAVGRNDQQSTAHLSRDETNRLLGMQPGQQAGNGDMVGVAVGDLTGRDVQTLRGEHVGEINGIVRNGGKTYAIIEHGGFLGIGGHEVAIPASRIAVQGDQVVLLGLTQQQLEQMPDYDFNKDQAVAGSETVQIGRYQ